MENAYAEETKFLSEKAAEKSRFSELSTDETWTKKKLCHTSSDKKATNFGLKLFNDASKSPNKFKEIISLILP